MDRHRRHSWHRMNLSGYLLDHSSRSLYPETNQSDTLPLGSRVSLLKVRKYIEREALDLPSLNAGRFPR
jgi:hypothetical protein